MVQCVREVLWRSTEAGGRGAESTVEGTLQFQIGWSGQASLTFEQGPKGGEGESHEDIWKQRRRHLGREEKSTSCNEMGSTRRFGVEVGHNVIWVLTSVCCCVEKELLGE